MAATHRALMLGDVIGTPGLERLSADLPALRKDTGADIVVANGENASGGFGLCDASAKALLGMGVDVITGGNHIWDKKGADALLDSGLPILRPVNYPAGAPGRGWIRLEKGGASWLVVNAQGRESMRPIDCPFRAVDAALAEDGTATGGQERVALVLLDFHAESFQEKQAMAWYLDGRVGAVAGTHTHVQTMDERVLPKGTGYIGDLGMCGPPDSVIGVTPESCLRRNLTQMPIRMEPAQGTAMINGALFTFDDAGHCLEIRRIRVM